MLQEHNMFLPMLDKSRITCLS